MTDATLWFGVAMAAAGLLVGAIAVGITAFVAWRRALDSADRWYAAHSSLRSERNELAERLMERAK